MAAETMRASTSLQHCRICRRITLAVLFFLLAIEVVVLVPSALTFRRAEASRMADAGWPRGQREAELDTRTRAYILRVAGIVGAIVLVVTAGTGFVIDRLVLRPVLELRKSSMAAAADPSRSAEFAVRETSQGRARRSGAGSQRAARAGGELHVE